MGIRRIQSLDPRGLTAQNNLLITSEEGATSAYTSPISDIFKQIGYISLGPFGWVATGHDFDPVTPGTPSNIVEVGDELFDMVEAGDILAETGPGPTPPAPVDYVNRWIIRQKIGTADPKRLVLDCQTLFDGDVSLLKSFLSTTASGSASSSYADDRLTIYGFLKTTTSWDATLFPQVDASVYVTKDGTGNKGGVFAGDVKVGGVFRKKSGTYINVEATNPGGYVDFEMIYSQANVQVDPFPGSTIEVVETLGLDISNTDSRITVEGLVSNPGGDFEISLGAPTPSASMLAYSGAGDVNLYGDAATQDESTGNLTNNIRIDGVNGLTRVYSPWFRANVPYTAGLYADKIFPARAYPGTYGTDSEGKLYTAGLSTTVVLVEEDYDNIYPGAEIVLNPTYIVEKQPLSKVYIVLSKLAGTSVQIDGEINISSSIDCFFKYSNQVALDDCPLEALETVDSQDNPIVVQAGKRPYITMSSSGGDFRNNVGQGFVFPFFGNASREPIGINKNLFSVSEGSDLITVLAPGDYMVKMFMTCWYLSGATGNGVGIKMQGRHEGETSFWDIDYLLAFEDAQRGSSSGITCTSSFNTTTLLLMEDGLMVPGTTLKPVIYGDITYDAPGSNITILQSHLSIVQIA